MKPSQAKPDYQALQAEYVTLCRKRGYLAYAQSKLATDSEEWQAGDKLHTDYNDRIEELRELLKGRV